MEDTTGHNSPIDEYNTDGRDDSNVMKRAILEFVSARIELAAIEAKEAAGLTLRKAIAAVALVIFAFFTWTLILAGITGLLADWAEQQLGNYLPGISGWIIMLFALAALHALVALILVIILKKKSTVPLFELTRQEIENDRAWVKNNK